MQSWFIGIIWRDYQWSLKNSGARVRTRITRVILEFFLPIKRRFDAWYLSFWMIFLLCFFFLAKADLVRDLRPLALPCCSNDYGGQNQAERESVYAKVKFEDSNLYKTLLVNRNLCTCIVLQRSNWQVTIGFRIWRITHRRFT